MHCAGMSVSFLIHTVNLHVLNPIPHLCLSRSLIEVLSLSGVGRVNLLGSFQYHCHISPLFALLTFLLWFSICFSGPSGYCIFPLWTVLCIHKTSVVNYLCICLYVWWYLKVNIYKTILIFYPRSVVLLI